MIRNVLGLLAITCFLFAAICFMGCFSDRTRYIIIVKIFTKEFCVDKGFGTLALALTGCVMVVLCRPSVLLVGCVTSYESTVNCSLQKEQKHDEMDSPSHHKANSTRCRTPVKKRFSIEAGTTIWLPMKRLEAREHNLIRDKQQEECEKKRGYRGL
jgi:hypothetical protein